VRCLPDEKKISAPSQTVATARIAPKVCHGQPPTFGSQHSKFHSNRFTFGGVITGRMKKNLNNFCIFTKNSKYLTMCVCNNTDYTALILLYTSRNLYGYESASSTLRCLPDQKKQNFAWFSSCRYCVDRTQNLPGPDPDNLLRVLQILSKSVNVGRCYS